MLSPVNTIPPLNHTHLDVHINSFDNEHKWGKPGNLPKRKPLSKNGQDVIEKNFHLVYEIRIYSKVVQFVL